MDNDKFKESLRASRKKYNELITSKQVEEFVTWGIIKPLKVYLFNEGIEVSIVVNYSKNYSYISLEGDYKDKKFILVITPEDTEELAMNKLEKKLKLFKDKEENNE